MINGEVVLEKNQELAQEELVRLERLNLEDYFYFFYPSKSKLVINSLLVGMEDTSLQVKRGVMDFLLSHMPITGIVNSLDERIKLVEQALIVVQKKDFAFLKKFFTWFNSHIEDEDVKAVDSRDPAIETLIPALKNLFKAFMKEENKDAMIPIHILTILFAEMPQNFGAPVLEAISVELIQYVRYFRNDPELIKKKFLTWSLNLFEEMEQNIHCIWKALGSLLSQQIRDISSQTSHDHSLEAIELIDFCLRDLDLEKIMKPKKEKQYMMKMGRED